MVYVDSMKARFGRMVMCHMMADTTEELLAMADRIGLVRRWIQYPGSIYEHFDISLSKKALAIRLGARLVTFAEMGRLINRRKLRGMDRGDNKPLPPYCFTRLTYVVFTDGEPSPECTEWFQFPNKISVVERERVILDYLDEIAREGRPGKQVMIHPVGWGYYPDRYRVPVDAVILQMSA